MKNTIPYHTGQTLSYSDYGDKNGRPILVQHGLIASIGFPQIFDRLAASGARLISIARPGYGESSPYAMASIGEWADIVSVLVDELGLDQFDVLGISSGAPYGYALGWKFPERVRNLYILSGIPALYDDAVLAHWPYPVNKSASIPEMQALAHDLFFAHLSQAEREQDDIKDSMMNNSFGVAQDLRLRMLDWGFTLADIPCRVVMRHSRADDTVPFITAELTSKLLPNCRLDIRDDDPHFSQQVLDDFIQTAMLNHA